MNPPERCPCGRVWQRGLRYGPTPEPVSVLVCWEGCGREWPPLLAPVERQHCQAGRHDWLTWKRMDPGDGRWRCYACRRDARLRRQTA